MLKLYLKVQKKPSLIHVVGKDIDDVYIEALKTLTINNELVKK